MLTLYTILVIVLLFGATIFVHELGHFLVARALGMVVDVFSIGFGPAVWKRKVGGVTYKIGVVPFGGYVALPQMDPTSGQAATEELAERKLPRAAPWKKILVSLAGAAGNVLFAVFLAYVVYRVGKPSAPHETSGLIGYVETNSAAYAASLREGDEIVAVDGQPVSNWDEITLGTAMKNEVTLEVRTGEGLRQVRLATEKNWLGVGMVPGISPVNLCSVAGTMEGSSAEQAGIQPGDVIVEFDGVPLYSREHLIHLVNEARDREVKARVRRNGELVELDVRPAYDEKAGRALIGVIFNTLDLDTRLLVHPRPGEQIKRHAAILFRLLRALLTPREAKAASQAVGGPIAILLMLWWTVQRSFALALWFTGLLNVNLAIINLLPIPILDGGHVLFSLWELVTRRPIGARLINAVMNFFAALIIAVFILITYRDIVRWIVPRFSGPAPAEAPTNAAPPEARPADAGN